MEAVPLTLFLSRRDGDYGDVPPRASNPFDIQAATEASYQKGLSEGRESAREAYAAAIDRQEEDYKFRIDQARRTWTETEGAEIVRQTTSAVTALKAEIEETVARILRPLVERRLVEEALAKLAVEIGKLLSDDDAIRLKICGPSDLVAQLGDQIASNIPVTVIARDQPEVTVFANKTVIETRLSECLARIGVQRYAQEEEG
jgi:hypothetical protein